MAVKLPKTHLTGLISVDLLFASALFMLTLYLKKRARLLFLGTGLACLLLVIRLNYAFTFF